MSAGDHSIWVKFSKDDGSASNNDTLQFKVAITLDEPFTPGAYWGYDITNITADHAIVVTASSSGPELYVKSGSTWVRVSRAYKKVGGAWWEVALNEAFDADTKYVKSQ